MIVLKTIGILLAVIVLLIFLLLLQNIRVIFSFSTEGKLELKAKILFFTLYDKSKIKPKKKEPVKQKPKEKKPSKISAYFQKLFGIDTLTDAADFKTNASESGIYDTLNKVITVFSLLLGQIVWLIKRIKLKKLHVKVICAGGDAADAAMDYGLVCAAVYPFVGYIETNFKTKKDAIDLQLGCDFDGDAYLGTDFIAQIRIIHIIRAVLKNAVNMANQQTQAEAKL